MSLNVLGSFFKGIYNKVIKPVVNKTGRFMQNPDNIQGVVDLATNIISQKKAWPNQILCVTFTNKAAKEMNNRVLQYLKGSSNAVPWLGTFHSISVNEV